MASHSTSVDKWTPATYATRFVEERTRPGIELLQRALAALNQRTLVRPNIKRAFDLGCGTGRFLPPLLDALPSITQLYAVDVSDKMLQEAQSFIQHGVSKETDRAKLVFTKQDIAQFKSLDVAVNVDLIYSNSALHWLPNQFDILRDAMAALNSGGCLAVQIPNDFDQPAHTLQITVLREFEEAHEVPPGTVDRVLAAAPRVESGGLLAYHEVLRPLSQHLDVFDTTYYQNLSCPLSTASEPTHPISHFLQGSSLGHVLCEIPEDKRKPFLFAFARRLESHYPTWTSHNAEGIAQTCSVYPFSRWFLIAIKL